MPQWKRAAPEGKGCSEEAMNETELCRLPPAERIKRYRELAQESRRLAQSNPDLDRQRILLFMADQWEGLAADAEKRAQRRKEWVID
jgi:hypothetical protein